jgi:hypothetical protein
MGTKKKNSQEEPVVIPLDLDDEIEEYEQNSVENGPEGRLDRLTGVLEYGAGGAVVADSDPVAEYRESLDKAAVLRLALGAPAPAGAWRGALV